jgi:hypothetical protein
MVTELGGKLGNWTVLAVVCRQAPYVFAAAVLAGLTLNPLRAMEDPPSGAVALLVDCEGSAVKATIAPGDPVHVLRGMTLDGQSCYSVIATVGGEQVGGFLPPGAHPAVVEFARKMAQQSRQVQFTVVPEEKKAAEAPPPPPPMVKFPQFRGTDMNGLPFSLNDVRARVVVVHFWSPRGPRTAHEAEILTYLYTSYRDKGLELVGVYKGISEDRLVSWCVNNEVTWPQIPDRQGLTAQVTALRPGPFYVLDRDHNVLAEASTVDGLEKTIVPLLSRGRSESR